MIRGDVSNSIHIQFLKSLGEEALSSWSWLKDTSDDSLPLVVRVSRFTGVSLNVCEFTSNESAISLTSPLEDLFADLASWELLLSKLGTEACLHSKVECSALFFDCWSLWSDWDVFGIFHPSSIDVSPPGAVIVFVGIATMMPVASVP